MAGRYREDVEGALRRVSRRRPDGDVTVQLLPHHLAAGALPGLVVGAELDVAPAIYAGDHLPALSEHETWSVDEFGCFGGRGGVITAPLDEEACSCRVDVLDVAGRLFPLNWAGAEPAEGRLWVEGALYLEPELAAGTTHGEAVALCRRRYRVREIRRYRRTGHRPGGPVRLDGVPGPHDVTEDAIYVADLRLVDDAVPVLVAEGAESVELR